MYNQRRFMLNVNPETVCFIISRTREFQAKEGVTFPEELVPGSENEYDWLQILADHKDDMMYKEAYSAIEDLEPDQKIELLALMYLGRGDYDAEDWQGARMEAKNNLPSDLTEYLFAKPQIAYYLDKGLEMLGYDCNL